MSKEDFSQTWQDLMLLRAEGKAVHCCNGEPVEPIIEAQVFEEADKRIDQAIKQKREVKRK
jgi:hypothetical protein